MSDHTSAPRLDKGSEKIKKIVSKKKQSLRRLKQKLKHTLNVTKPKYPRKPRPSKLWYRKPVHLFPLRYRQL